MTIAPLVRFTGNRQPPISGQILVDGAPPATALGAGGEVVTFYMRPVGSSSPIVSGGAVTVDSAAKATEQDIIRESATRPSFVFIIGRGSYPGALSR